MMLDGEIRDICTLAHGVVPDVEGAAGMRTHSPSSNPWARVPSFHAGGALLAFLATL